MRGFGRLFSFSGRTTRLNYWRIYLASTAALAVVGCAGFFLATSFQIGALSAISLIGAAPIAWIGWARAVRRLHDRNKSGWWLLVFYAPVVAALALKNPWVSANLSDAALAAVSFAALALLAWGFVELGLLRGTRGPNQYGPDPLAA